MRQAGVLAAAGLLALRDGPALLALDHARAQRLARGLAELPWARVDVPTVETNIVMCDLPTASPEALLAHCKTHGVLAAKAGKHRIRFVLHRDLDDGSVQRCLHACQTFAASTSSAFV
jgi:threonine aldolase